jgi:WD40 repeat protein
MSFKNQSKFRNVKPTPSKVFFGDVRISKPAGPSSQIAVSAKHIALPYANNNIALLPISPDVFDPRKSRKQPPEIAGHKAALTDLAFSPFDAGLLGSTSKDGSFALWNIPDNILDGGVSAENVLTVDTFSGGASRLDFHPAAKDVVLVGGKSKVSLINLETKEEFRTFDFADVLSVGFSGTGSQAYVLRKDQKLLILDPRSPDIASEIDVRCTLPHTGVWLGTEDKVVIYGQDRTKKPQVEIWDPTRLSAPVVADQIGQSTGDIL